MGQFYTIEKRNQNAEFRIERLVAKYKYYYERQYACDIEKETETKNNFLFTTWTYLKIINNRLVQRSGTFEIAAQTLPRTLHVFLRNISHRKPAKTCIFKQDDVNQPNTIKNCVVFHCVFCHLFLDGWLWNAFGIFVFAHITHINLDIYKHCKSCLLYFSSRIKLINCNMFGLFSHTVKHLNMECDLTNTFI